MFFHGFSYSFIWYVHALPWDIQDLVYLKGIIIATTLSLTLLFFQSSRFGVFGSKSSTFQVWRHRRHRGGELIWIQLSPDKIWRNTKTSWQEDSKDVDEHLVLWVSFSLAHFHAYDWNWLDLSKLYWIYFFVCALAFVCKQLTVLLPQICSLLFVWLGKETLQAVGLSKTEGEIFVSSAFMCFLGID